MTGVNDVERGYCKEWRVHSWFCGSVSAVIDILDGVIGCSDNMNPLLNVCCLLTYFQPVRNMCRSGTGALPGVLFSRQPGRITRFK
jgi:hypothetical protein